jgi:hypothetical protein
VDASHVVSSPGSVAAGRNVWPRYQLFAVRAAAVYFALLFLDSLADTFNVTRTALASLQRAVVRGVVWVAGGPPPTAGPNWVTSSAASVAVLLLATAATAAVVAGIWTMADRRRTEHDTLHLWLRTALRYYAAVVVLIYGGFKVINSQFPPLQPEQLMQPIGTLSPMSLLWHYMGYSDYYSGFAGLGEVTGALLLFHRRTVSLGACVLLGVLGNVAMLNYAYDVPVKGLSTNLVLIALVLLVPDLPRLRDLFVFNRATVPAPEARALGGPRTQRVRRFLKPAIVGLALVVPVAISSRVRPALHQRSPLYGVYEVRSFVRNGDTVPPLVTNVDRWRRIAFGTPERGSIQFMNDSVATMVVQVDTAMRQLTLSPARAPRQRLVLSYDVGTDGILRVRGRVERDSIAAEVVHEDMERRYRLSRGFRWFGP